MKTLAIYGVGGTAREALDTARMINGLRPTCSNIVMLNDFLVRDDERIVNGAAVYTSGEFFVKYSPEEAVTVVGAGEPEDRAFLAKKLSDKGYTLTTIVHPSAFIGGCTEIGCGTIICYGSFISCNTKIGVNVLLQPSAGIGHDVVISDHSVISSHVLIGGYSHIGSKTFVGMNVAVKEKTTIGSQTVIGMGSAVFRDIPDNVRALGNPARVMKNNDSKRVYSEAYVNTDMSES